MAHKKRSSQRPRYGAKKPAQAGKRSPREITNDFKELRTVRHRGNVGRKRKLVRVK